MATVGVYRWAQDYEFDKWKKGVGCWRWAIDNRRPEPDYISNYFERKPRDYPQDPVQVDLPPEVMNSKAAKKFAFKSARKGYGTSRFLKRK